MRTARATATPLVCQNANRETPRPAACMDHSTTAPAADLLRAFLDARYAVFLPGGTVELRPGAVFSTPLAPPGTAWALLTAHNPRAVAQSPADNAAAQTRLLARLHAAGHRCWPGRNDDGHGGHAEDTVFTLGIDLPFADALAFEFAQCALLAGRTGEPARLRCLRAWWPGAVVDTPFVDWVACAVAHPRSP